MRERVELVHVDSGFRVRKVGGNGEQIWHTEVYEAREWAETTATREAALIGDSDFRYVDERRS